MSNQKIRYADDDTTTILDLVRMRIPSLGLGLLLGILLSFVTSRFEEVLMHNVQVAFFIPFIVYMADAVGTQTQSIYIRDLKTKKASFHRYLVKESFIGILFGAMASSIAAAVTWFWLKTPLLTLAVSLAMFVAISIAPLVALFIAEFLELEHTDPAVGAGPIATVIQDTLSVVIFGLIASLIML